MSAVEQNTSVPEEGIETKSTIQKKLKSGDCKLLEKVDGKAEFWKCFNKVVFDNETEKETGFVSCTKCKTLMVYIYNTGSSHLSRHKCALVSRESKSLMLSFVTKKKKISTKQMSSTNVRKNVLDLSTKISVLWI